MMREIRSFKQGFTLVEMLLGMTILALVLGSVFAAMQAGMDAFERGQRAMELYQNGRIGLRQVSEELRFALAADAFWRPEDSIEFYDPDQMHFILEESQREMIREHDPGAIRFRGKKNSVLFVRKKYQMGLNPPFDLQECRLHVEDGRLVLDILRSLLSVKQASWFFASLFDTNLAGTVISDQGQPIRYREVSPEEPMPLTEFIGSYGRLERRHVIAEGIDSISFRYSRGERWQSSWDSQKIISENLISPQSPNFDPHKDVRLREIGLPAIVQITLELENGEILTTASDIPAGNQQRGPEFFERGDGGSVRQPNEGAPPRETGSAAPAPAGQRAAPRNPGNPLPQLQRSQ